VAQAVDIRVMGAVRLPVTRFTPDSGHGPSASHRSATDGKHSRDTTTNVIKAKRKGATLYFNDLERISVIYKHSQRARRNGRILCR
jgi:hypothetical protein